MHTTAYLRSLPTVTVSTTAEEVIEDGLTTIPSIAETLQAETVEDAGLGAGLPLVPEGGAAGATVTVDVHAAPEDEVIPPANVVQ